MHSLQPKRPMLPHQIRFLWLISQLWTCKFLIELRLFHECDAPVAVQLARNASFAVALASKPIAYHAAVLQAAECDQVPTVKSLPYLQCLGYCLMHQ